MKPISLRESALLVVDLQQGFTTLCPKELPVPGGLEIVPAVNQLLAMEWARIDASADWHPPDHCSFLGQAYDLYPPHCVQNTPGADFVPGLDTWRFHTIWRKGFQRDHEDYSVTSQHFSMPELYSQANIYNVVICGIATNICCLDAACSFRHSGFRVLIVEDACAGIDVPAAGLFQAKAKQDGLARGIEYIQREEMIVTP